MSEVSFSKMNFSDNEIKTKLKVDEYVFEIEEKIYIILILHIV